jgi:hypothetical protein
LEISVVRMIQVATVGEHHEREQNTDNVQDRQTAHLSARVRLVDFEDCRVW